MPRGLAAITCGLAIVTQSGACHHAAPSKPTAKPVAVDTDPDGPHRAEIAKQVQPYLDADLTSSVVVAITDGGKHEIYGFGHGPNNKAPDGHTLYELGSVSKVYTSLLFADAIQRREVELDTPLAELLPPGVTAPTKDKVAITLRHLALHTAGLPRVPPTVAQQGEQPDPYAKFDEDALYRDLVHTPLAVVPGTQVEYSNYGVGVLGFVLGKKLDGNYARAVTARVLKPLELRDTFVGTPPEVAARRAIGTNDDLAAVPPWTFDALAGAGALVSSARDQLALLDAELDAAAGGQTTLRRAMKLTQEPQLDVPATQTNEGLGWQIDRAGRYWHNGATGGYHAYVGFDPKTRRGVVVLASTSTSLVEHLADVLYKVMEGAPPAAPVLATAKQLSEFAGHYDLAGEKLALTAAGNRLYVEGSGEPRHRLLPISEHEFWIEALQTVAVFERDDKDPDHKVNRLIFVIGERQLAAQRVD